MRSITGFAIRTAAPAAVVALLALLAGCAGSQHRVESTPRRAPASGATPATAMPAEPETETRAVTGIHHVVQQRQTMWRIARAYGLTVGELASANEILDPTQLSVGQRLFIPGATAEIYVPSYPAPRATHVRAGDDIWTWPVPGGRVLSRYGSPRPTHRHQGIDIDGNPGQAVLAVRNGVVVYSGSSMRGYGKTIIVDHGDGLRSLYAHNSALLVGRGTRVRRGDRVARIGRTGNASTEHCHLEIRRGDVPVDPLLYLAPSEERR